MFAIAWDLRLILDIRFDFTNKETIVPQETIYRTVASSRQVYYSILNSFGQISQYISIKFPLYKQSENP